MLFETVVLALLVTVCLKRTAKLLEIELEWIGLPLTAFILEKAAGSEYVMKSFVFTQYKDVLTLIIEIIVYCLLLLFLHRNRKYIGMRFMFVGFLLNGIVIILNGGFMPVSPELGVKYGFQNTLEALVQGEIFAHEVLTKNTVCSFLADVIPVPPPWIRPKTISIGDVFIDIGVLVFFMENTMVKKIEMPEADFEKH